MLAHSPPIPFTVSHRPRQFSTSRASKSLPLGQVLLLPSWDPIAFQDKAYQPGLPARLPRSRHHLPPACSKWFLHEDKIDFDLTGTQTGGGDDHVSIPHSSELRSAFWSAHESTMVPLELTRTPSLTGSSGKGEETFHRVEAPLKILLAYLSHAGSPPPEEVTAVEGSHSVYLAQCDLSSLPASVQSDIPTPSLLTPSANVKGKAQASGLIKGDIYASSLWLGRPPTYTPLHRDPNPNLFVQLAGRKVLRLLPPEVGDAVFADVQSRLATTTTANGSAAIRGHEMMSGPEKKPLHDAVWADDTNVNPYAEVLRTYGLETQVGLGDAVFLPKGWWHSVKGVGSGVTASANWWFR